MDWPITTSSAPKTASGRRLIAYRNAPRSGAAESARGCRLLCIARWEASSTRSRVSPVLRSTVV